VFVCIYIVLNLKTKVYLFLSYLLQKTLPATPMNGDGHLQAIAGSNQGWQDFSSTQKVQTKLDLSLSLNRAEKVCLLSLIYFLKHLSKND